MYPQKRTDIIEKSIIPWSWIDAFFWLETYIL